MGIIEPKDQKQIYFCAICGGNGGTKHHLLPKSTRREWRGPGGSQMMPTMRTCRKCHDDIHYFISHWELAMFFTSEDKLKNELARRKAWRSSPNAGADAPATDDKRTL